MENKTRKILFNVVYVPIMKRYGEDEGHQYILGIFEDLETAAKLAEEHREYRGGKYEWVIEAYSMNKTRGDSRKELDIFRIAKSKEMDCFIDSDFISIKEIMKRPENKGKSFDELMDIVEKEENGKV